MRPDFHRIVPDLLYSVMAARKLLGISHTTIYEYMRQSPPVLPYRRSENGWHRLILGSDIIFSTTRRSSGEENGRTDKSALSVPEIPR